MRKSILLLLCIVLICGSILRVYGLAWGVPRKPYWRYHYQDEGSTLGLILKMKPTDLNPHYFINPTFHYYTLLLSLKAASLTGHIKPFSMPVKLEGLGRPQEGVPISDYAVVKEFKRDFNIFGITLVPYFPNMNWNPVNPTIYIFKAKF